MDKKKTDESKSNKERRKEKKHLYYGFYETGQSFL